VDTISREKRSALMSRIRGRDTTPERLLRAALWRAGLRGWRLDFRGAVGRPDVAFSRRRVAVFVDGRFWHGHPRYFTPGKSGAYWDRKIARNKARDASVSAALRRSGWKVLRFWDFAVESDPDRVAYRVALALKDRRAVHGAPARAGEVAKARVKGGLRA
jgi:DNA mismatch endonuclease (patch repair protein)